MLHLSPPLPGSDVNAGVSLSDDRIRSTTFSDTKGNFDTTPGEREKEQSLNKEQTTPSTSSPETDSKTVSHPVSEEITATPPSSSSSPGAWTEAALDFLDDVTKNAQWVLLYAKILDRVREEDGRSIPRIELWDTNSGEDVNIAESLVNAGHAAWCDDGR